MIRKNGSQAQTVRLRNQWVAIDPRDWKARNDMTINVGLGTGSKSEQLAHLQLIIAAQEKAIPAGMVSPKNLYASARELTKLAGHKNVDAFFTPPGQPSDPNDPTSAPIQPPSDPQMAALERKAEIEKLQAQADIETQNKKTEAEMALAQQRFELEKQLKLLDAQIKQEQHGQAMTMQAVRAMTARKTPSAGAEHPMTAGEPPEPAEAPDPSAALVAGMMETLQRLAAPKRARKLADGSWVTETVQ